MTPLVALALVGAALMSRQDPVAPGRRQPGPQFIAIAVGDAFSCALAADGQVFCWGTVPNGPDLDSANFTVPRPLRGQLRYRQLSVGYENACALSTEGRMYCWPVDSTMSCPFDDRSRTDCVLLPYQAPHPDLIGWRFRSVSVGMSTRVGSLPSCGITVDGETLCGGQRFEPAPGQRFGQVSAGLDHVCALDAAGLAYCWGNGLSGELGDSTIRPSPPFSATAGIIREGGNIRYGMVTDRRMPIRVAGGIRFRSISAGDQHTCGVTEAGAAWCWGWNESGQLGDGTRTARATPVQVTGGIRFALVRAGSTTTGSITCGIDVEGRAYCWGSNGDPSEVTVGLLGDSTPPTVSAFSPQPVPVLSTERFRDIDARGNHVCAVTVGGDVRCWGDNRNGELGDGTRVSRMLPTPLRLLDEGMMARVSAVQQRYRIARTTPTECVRLLRRAIDEHVTVFSAWSEYCGRDISDIVTDPDQYTELGFGPALDHLMRIDSLLTAAEWKLPPTDIIALTAYGLAEISQKASRREDACRWLDRYARVGVDSVAVNRRRLWRCPAARPAPAAPAQTPQPSAEHPLMGVARMVTEVISSQGARRDSVWTTLLDPPDVSAACQKMAARWTTGCAPERERRELFRQSSVRLAGELTGLRNASSGSTGRTEMRIVGIEDGPLAGEAIATFEWRWPTATGWTLGR